MNELIYSFRESKVRVVEVEGEFWFVGKDVAEVLGYKDTSDALKRHVDEEDKLSRGITDSGQMRKMYLINESGVYGLIFSSKLDAAKDFKRWVTNEVLPAIRKTGSYQAPLNRQQLTEALTIEVSKELDFVKQDIASLKEQVNDRMTIDYGEQLQLLNTKNKRVESLHNDSHAHIERSLMHRKAWSDYKRAFGVSSYRDTLVKDLDEALKYLMAWRPLV